ncbi:putative DUF3159 family protein [Actinoalloteichus hymeniacidonis]|uniref:DUF3159 family protein n=2 Tax=Actinoalloteichus hymeniacidonis TaxID=340345 RepID=A0AAC9HMA4_9PSEU|nr:putative DUF3159 family protein [Actinoalloteichus hymeniacidonis]
MRPEQDATEVHPTIAPTEAPPATPTLLEQSGGVSGAIYAGIPVVVFVVANSAWGLTMAIWLSVGAAVLITLVQLLRKVPFSQASSGLIGVGICVLLAQLTGSADGFFLFGIWSSLVFAVVSLLTMVLRWPLAGVIGGLTNGKGNVWREDKPSMRAYNIATLALVAMFASRFVVQQWLFVEESTGWLAVADIVMGFPLLAVAGLVVVWAVRFSTKRLKALEEQPVQNG